MEKPIPCKNLHCVVLSVVDMLVKSMFLEALYPLLQNCLPLYILQTNLSQHNQGDFFLCFCGGFFFVLLWLLCSFLLIELHHLDMLEVINHTCCLHDPLLFNFEARITISSLLAEQMKCVEFRMLNATQDTDTWREKPKLLKHIQEICEDITSEREEVIKKTIENRKEKEKVRNRHVTRIK